MNCPVCDRPFTRKYCMDKTKIVVYRPCGCTYVPLREVVLEGYELERRGEIATIIGGKFDGQAVYVPYLVYHRRVDDIERRDNRAVLTYLINDQDRLAFHELRGIEVVRLTGAENGSRIIEV